MKPTAHLLVNGRKRRVRCEVEPNGNLVFTVPESWTKDGAATVEVLSVTLPMSAGAVSR